MPANTRQIKTWCTLHSISAVCCNLILENPAPPPPLPLSHEIRAVTQERKAWKRMEVDRRHRWDIPNATAAEKDRYNQLRVEQVAGMITRKAIVLFVT